MKNRSGFSLVELLIVLVVIGILASYSIPRVNRDNRTEAMTDMLNMIRYAQNLALHDSVHKRFDTKWQRSYWRFQIYKCAKGTGLFYMIGKDGNMNGSIDRGETAIDPSNGKYLFWNTKYKCKKDSENSSIDIKTISPNIFITQKYGINKVDFKKCAVYKGSEYNTTVSHVGFDNFGRPHKSYTKNLKPRHFGYQLRTCKIKFSFVNSSTKPFTIKIEPETGYAYIPENPNL